VPARSNNRHVEQDLRTALPRVAPEGDGCPAPDTGEWARQCRQPPHLASCGAMTSFLGTDRALPGHCAGRPGAHPGLLRSGGGTGSGDRQLAARPCRAATASLSASFCATSPLPAPTMCNATFPRVVYGGRSRRGAEFGIIDRKDRLQARWVRSVCKRDIDVPAHWLPSIQAFVDAGVAGIGWGVNPFLLVQAQIRDGTLIELVPGRTLSGAAVLAAHAAANAHVGAPDAGGRVRGAQHPAR